MRFKETMRKSLLREKHQNSMERMAERTAQATAHNMNTNNSVGSDAGLIVSDSEDDELEGNSKRPAPDALRADTLEVHQTSRSEGTEPHSVIVNVAYDL